MRRGRRFASHPASRATGDGSSVWEILPATPRQPAVGRAVTRRSVLAGMGALGAAALTGCGGGDSGGSSVQTLGSNLRDLATVPTLTVESSPSGLISGPVAVRFQFSGDVANFDDLSGFSVSGGTVVAGSFTRITLSEYSVRIAPFAELVGTMRMAVHPFDIKDASGAIGRRSLYGFAWPYDTVTRKVPLNWATIRDALGDALWAGGPLMLNITFNLEISRNFTTEAVRQALWVTGATMSDLSRVSDAAYALTVTPVAGASMVTVELNPGALGVETMATNPRGWTWVRWGKRIPDNWVVFRDPLGDTPWTGGPLVLTITFNVPISKGFTQDALSVDGATLSEFTQVSGTVYTVKMTPTVLGNHMFLSLEPAAVGVVPMPNDGFSWQLAAWSKTKWPD